MIYVTKFLHIPEFFRVNHFFYVIAKNKNYLCIE